MHIHTLDLGFLDLNAAVAVFVVEGPEGLALIETGPASTLPHLEKVLAKNGWQIADFQHVFLTHIHFDHAGAAWAFAEKGATIYVHPLGLPHLAAPEKLYNSARMIYGEAMDQLWGPMHPIPVEQLYAPAHGELIEAVGLQFAAWYTPGHAVHHIAWEVAPPNPPVKGGDDTHSAESAEFSAQATPDVLPSLETAPPSPPVKEGDDTHSAVGEERTMPTLDVLPPFTGVSGGASFSGRAVFTGDVAGVRIHGGPVMPPCPPPDIQVEDWQQSIELLRGIPSKTMYLTHFGPVTDKLAHLDALEQHLLDWAEWMRPYAEQDTPAAEIVPAFQEFVKQNLMAQGVTPDFIQRYEAANPAFMSVAGLLRYWKKKNRK